MRFSPTLIAIITVSSVLGLSSRASGETVSNTSSSPTPATNVALVADLAGDQVVKSTPPTLVTVAEASPAVPAMGNAAPDRGSPVSAAVMATEAQPAATVYPSPDFPTVASLEPSPNAEITPAHGPAAAVAFSDRSLEAATPLTAADNLAQSDSPASDTGDGAVPNSADPAADDADTSTSPAADESADEPEATPSEAAPGDQMQEDTPTPESTSETPDGTDEGTTGNDTSTEAPEEPRVLVAEVAVESPSGNLDEQLVQEVYGAIETRPGQTTTRTQLQRDINNIFATGYFSNVRAQPTDTPLGVRVTFLVQPNPVLQAVRVEGNEVLPQSKVDEVFSPQYGKIINLIDFQDGILELNEWYQDNGYVLAQVVSAPQVSEDGVVTLEVAEGVIEDIQVRFLNSDGQSEDEEGNPINGKTRDFIITREFSTQPGDVFNESQIQQDLQQVYGLGIFEDVRLSLEPGQEDPRKVDVVVNVIEGNTGSVAAGLGFNFTGDLFGTVSYRQDNFGGNNQKFSAEAQLSSRDLLFDLSFTDPWIGGDPYRTSYTTNAFLRRSINLNFDGGPNPIDLNNGDRVRIRRLGGDISFSRPLGGGWTVSVGASYQNVSARDSNGVLNTVDSAGNPLTASSRGVDDLFTIPVSAVLDRRDDPFNPTSGSVVRLSMEQSIPLGSGSIFMNRMRGSYSYYLPVSLINFSDGPQSLAFNVQLGTILGDLPPYEAFALGGTNSVRGYDEGEVGSGRTYGQMTVEYRFPLFSFLGAALFVDAATDFGSGDAVPGAPGPSRGKPGSGFGYGAGVRVQTPLGPIRIDYGINDQGQGRLHFGIGERF